MRVSFSTRNSAFAHAVIHKLSHTCDMIEVGKSELFLADDSLATIRSADFHLLILTDSFFGITGENQRLPLDFISDIINVCLSNNQKLLVLNSSLALGSGKVGKVINAKTSWEDDNWISSALYFQLAHRDITRAVAEGATLKEYFLPAVEMNDTNNAFQKEMKQFIEKATYPTGSNGVTHFSKLMEILKSDLVSPDDSTSQLVLSENITWKSYLDSKAQENGLPKPIKPFQFSRPNVMIKYLSRLWSSDEHTKQRDLLMSQKLVYQTITMSANPA